MITPVSHVQQVTAKVEIHHERERRADIEAAKNMKEKRQKSKRHKRWHYRWQRHQFISTSLKEIAAMRPQWKFSKYLGLLVVDQLMSGSAKERDEITTRIYLYATSASDNSAPYIKIS